MKLEICTKYLMSYDTNFLVPIAATTNFKKKLILLYKKTKKKQRLTFCSYCLCY